MCTAISYCGKRHFFGRNLDLEYHFSEQVVVTPRNVNLHFRNGTLLKSHHAMIGMATVSEGYPLYYEATNEWGLSVAGLNFPGNAVYNPRCENSENVAPFELIPWILCQCKTVQEARQRLERCSIWALPYSQTFSLSPLHWMIADKAQSIVAEPMTDGLRIYENPLEVLTNNPPFPYHMHHLADFLHLTANGVNTEFQPEGVAPYSNGMGAMGLPGDYSSSSRFVRAAFVKEHSMGGDDEICQFFHLLSTVAMPRGSVLVNGKPEITRYSCCCDTNKGIYYYRTYDNSRITAIHLRRCPLDSNHIQCFNLRQANDILHEN